MISSTRCTSLGDSPSDGSSIRISDGLAIRARPIASICCSPPRERAAGIVEPFGELGEFREHGLERPVLAAGIERVRARPASALVGSIRFSRTESDLKMRRPCGTIAMPACAIA